MAEREMVPYSPGQDGLGSVLVKIVGEGAAMETSLDLTTEHGQMCYAASIGEPTHRGGMSIGMEFAVVDYLVSTYVPADTEDGEVTRRPRLCLFARDGSCLAIQSVYGVESFLMLCCMWGLPPWEPARRIRVVKAGKAYRLAPAFVAQAPNGPITPKKEGKR